MKLSVKIRPEPDVNLTSLIDVVLLLIIFFMVSTTFVKQSEISVSLPQADNVAPAAVPKGIDIMITDQGTFLINGRELVNSRPEIIRNGLEMVSGGDTTLPLTISADADARHQDVVTAMDVAGKLGFVQISIATVNDPAGQDRD